MTEINTNEPCDPGCLGWLIANEGTPHALGEIERCDECHVAGAKLGLESDSDAADVARAAGYGVVEYGNHFVVTRTPEGATYTPPAPTALDGPRGES